MPRRYYNISYPAHPRTYVHATSLDLIAVTEERNVMSEEIERNVSGHANEMWPRATRFRFSLLIELNSNLLDISIRKRYRRTRSKYVKWFREMGQVLRDRQRATKQRERGGGEKRERQREKNKRWRRTSCTGKKNGVGRGDASQWQAAESARKFHCTRVFPFRASAPLMLAVHPRSLAKSPIVFYSVALFYLRGTGGETGKGDRVAMGSISSRFRNSRTLRKSPK